MIETRDEARQAIKNAGITGATVSKSDLYLLWLSISMEMDSSDCYKGSMRMNNPPSKFMTCRTDQWESREAVSFNDDGFVGIAGWADKNNVVPFLSGIERWVKSINKQSEV